ncbi:thioesterase [Pseudopedobacter saltans DSM 12145]|uniref:Thioesterase n=1 Tax=Pseudopedobacter saltans (strain ATCC 51119 / DSM 12145 / JCM 21818 / CCUG 39354 / LMG 10337 / NBRC 100064 / NCIMB 13643) TaxID=762903 RepID=F0SBJ9_PSESL|nr:acyl-CoA thioesterase [Pseudopedobacter saltans]ADY51645.1 thioesterase [Pseudopedobacter saltans DSM 12145]
MSEYKKFKTEHKVRPDDIDMFNHVHNSIYLDYVLAARYEQMELFYGMAMDEFLKLGFGWVVQKVQIEYKRPLKLGDTFSVETGIVNIGEKGCKVEFTINNLKTNKTSTIGWFDFVMIDMKTGRSAVLPESIIKLYSI